MRRRDAGSSDKGFTLNILIGEERFLNGSPRDASQLRKVWHDWYRNLLQMIITDYMELLEVHLCKAGVYGVSEVLDYFGALRFSVVPKDRRSIELRVLRSLPGPCLKRVQSCGVCMSVCRNSRNFSGERNDVEIRGRS